MDVIDGFFYRDCRSITTIILLCQLIICDVYLWFTDIVIHLCRIHGDEEISNLARLDCHGELYIQINLRLLD